MGLHPGSPGHVCQAAEANALFTVRQSINGLQETDREAWLITAAWHFCIWGFDMYWTYCGVREDRRVGWPGEATPERDMTKAGMRSVPRTFEQVLFLIEERTEIGDRPSRTAH